jgi:sugar/nucleoside kinase (ribokinase family)
VVVDAPSASFDVICAGEAVWSVAPPDASRSAEWTSLRFRPGGGAVNAALALARQELRVGLATVLEDRSAGRGLLEKIAAAGVEVGGVSLARPNTGLVFVRGGARQALSFGQEAQPIEIPAGWSSRVLLLSGMSPVVPQAASLCKAARAARRAGSLVVVDVNARWDLWEGRDSRAIHMVLREADVVWCSAEDLFGLNMSATAIRATMRPNAVLALSDGGGRAFATGPFGEVAQSRERTALLGPTGEGEAFATAICVELARAGHAGEHSAELWARALQRGHVAATSASALTRR